MAELKDSSGRILTFKGLKFVEEGRLAVVLEIGFAGKELEAR